MPVGCPITKGTGVDERPIDADNHYYEPLDAFTRYLPREFADRGVRPVQDGKRVKLLIGGKLNTFVPNPTFDPIIVPGCLDPLFRGQVPDGVDRRSLIEVEPLRSEYRERDDRIRVMDEQGLRAAVLFPTLGCGVEEALSHDVEATMVSLSAFNSWLDEDWGYDHEGRLLAAPMLSLADPVAAADEVDVLLERGVRIVHVRPAPVPGPNGVSRSLGDRSHDAVWAKLAEADVPVGFHLCDSGYEWRIGGAWGAGTEFGFAKTNPLAKVMSEGRAIHDTIASMVIDGVFTRHPNLRVASIENGSDWLYGLIRHLRKQANQTPWAFDDDPRDVVRNHVWVAPYLEEDLAGLAELMGVERILFGSDWPHGEGTATPMGFAEELGVFDEDQQRRIRYENAIELLGSAP